MDTTITLSLEEIELMVALQHAKEAVEDAEQVLALKRYAYEQAIHHLLTYVHRRYRVIHPRGSEENT